MKIPPFNIGGYYLDAGFYINRVLTHLESILLKRTIELGRINNAINTLMIDFLTVPEPATNGQD